MTTRSGPHVSRLHGAISNKLCSLFCALLMAVLFCLVPLASASSSGKTKTKITIETAAGGGTVNGNPSQADIPGPTAAVFDASGNLYVAAPFAEYVFEKSAAGVVTQFAGLGWLDYNKFPGPANTEPLWNPSGLAVDSQGNIYIADTGNNTIRKVDTSGYLTTVAGISRPCYQRKCGDGGPAVDALLNNPQGVAVDAAGNIYIADTGDDRVRIVTPDGNIAPFAGVFGSPCLTPTGPCGDGASAKQASLSGPTAVAVDKKGNVYIADTGDNRVRVVVPKHHIIQAFAGNGTTCVPVWGACGDGGSALSANMGPPQAVAVDSAANVYIADPRGSRIRVVASGNISNFAGIAAQNNRGFSGDGGSATNALLNGPNGVSVDGSGNVYISDTGNQRVREVRKTDGVISTLLGGGNGGDNGTAVAAQLANPYAIAVDSAGNYYIADNTNNRIRVVSNGTIQTVAGTGNANYTGDQGKATLATLNGPKGVAIDASGNIFIGDTVNRVVREVTGGNITTFAGTGHPCTPTTGACGDGGLATDAWLSSPTTVTTDAAGNVFIADPKTNRVREVSGGVITTVAGTGNAGYSGDCLPATSANLNAPAGVAVDASENIFIADSANNVIRCVLGVAGGCGDTQRHCRVGDIVTYAYNGAEKFQGDGGPALQASRWNPTQLAVDSRGNLFVGGGNDYLVQRIDAASNIVITVAGNDQAWWYYGFKGDGGSAIVARINSSGLAIDGNQNLYLADDGNNRIREVSTLVPIVAFDPKKLDFGTVTVGQTSQPQTVTLKNTGDDDLSISSITAHSDFAQTNNCPVGSGTLAPSASCSLSVTFSPTKKGTRDGFISVVDNAPDLKQKLRLTGVGQ